MDGQRLNMDGDSAKEEKKRSLMEFIINEDAIPPVQQKPYWLWGECTNSYSSRYLKKHRSTKTADGRRRRKEDPPQQPYVWKSRCESAEKGKKTVCCQVNIGRKLSDLLASGKIRKGMLNERQKECVQTYHSSLL